MRRLGLIVGATDMGILEQMKALSVEGQPQVQITRKHPGVCLLALLICMISECCHMRYQLLFTIFLHLFLG